MPRQYILKQLLTLNVETIKLLAVHGFGKSADSLIGWRFGVVVSTMVSINEVNLRRARLVPCPGFNSRCRKIYLSI